MAEYDASTLLVDRNLALELVRVTEAAALAASRWIGRGDKNAADGAAVDAMRKAFDTVAISGTVVIADDSVLLREGIARLLADAGFEVVGQADDAEQLLLKVRSYEPDVAIVDIRMPPTHTDEGLQAAREIRERHPGTGVLVLSQYVEPEYALELLSESAEGVGYLLKNRVSDITEFAAAVRRVVEV